MLLAYVIKFYDGGIVLEVYKEQGFGIALTFKNIIEDGKKYTGLSIQIFNILIMIGFAREQS